MLLNKKMWFDLLTVALKNVPADLPTEAVLTISWLQIGDTEFPDGFIVWSDGQEIGRFAYDITSISSEAPTLLLNLPEMYRLILNQQCLVCQVDLEQACQALDSGTALVDVTLMWHLASLNMILKSSVDLVEKSFDGNITAQQERLSSCLNEIPEKVSTDSPQYIQLADSGYWLDLVKNRFVRYPDKSPVQSTAAGCFLISPPGAGRKRITLSYLKNADLREPTEQQQESLLNCSSKVLIISKRKRLEDWKQAALEMNYSVLLINDFEQWSRCTTQDLLQSDVCLVSTKLIHDIRYWLNNDFVSSYITQGIRREDIVLYLQRSTSLGSLPPLLDLAYWRGIIWADVGSPKTARLFTAARSMVLLQSTLPVLDTSRVHRILKMIRLKADKAFHPQAMAQAYGIYWSPTLPELQTKTVSVPMHSSSKAWLLENGQDFDQDMLLLPQTSSRLTTRELAPSLLQKDNQLMIKNLDRRLARAKQDESELLQAASHLHSFSSLPEWTEFQIKVIDDELKRTSQVQSDLTRIALALSAVNESLIKQSLADKCPVCFEEDQELALLHCGHAVCWICCHHLIDTEGDSCFDCPQCRLPTHCKELYLVGSKLEADHSSKMRELESIVDSRDVFTLVVVGNEKARDAIVRHLQPRSVSSLAHIGPNTKILVAMEEEIKHRHFLAQHLVLMHSELTGLDSTVRHAGQSEAKLFCTRLIYDRLEDED